MTTADVIDAVYENLAALRRELRGRQLAVVQEIEQDLDRIGLRAFLSQLHARGVLIQRQEQQLHAKRLTLANVRRLEDAYEHLAITLAETNRDLEDQLRRVAATNGEKQSAKTGKR